MNSAENLCLNPLEIWISKKIGKRSISREDIQNYQWLMLQKTLTRVCEKSRFYKNHFRGFSINDLNGMSDIQNLPLTDALNIAENDKGFLCMSQSQIQRVVTLQTSGTTGNPKRIYFSKNDIELTIDFFQQGMSVFTSPGERVLILLPGVTPGSIGDLLKMGLTRLGVESITYGVVDDSEKISKMIVNQQITGIVGIPQQILSLVYENNAAEIKNQGRLKSVLLSTDYVSPSLVKQIEENWGCKVFEHYGSTEMGLGGGVFCQARRGYHLREADMYFEIIDPKTGKNVPDGEYGEVVFSTLTREAMPLIRYRTGDISRFLLNHCECNTVLKTMAPISGRLTNSITFENGEKAMLSEFEDCFFKCDGLINFDISISRSSDVEFNQKKANQHDKDIMLINLGFHSNLLETEKKKSEALIKRIFKDEIIEKKNLSEILWVEFRPLDHQEIDVRAMKKRQIIDRRYL